MLNQQLLGEVLSPLEKHDNAAAFEALQASWGNKGRSFFAFDYVLYKYCVFSKTPGMRKFRIEDSPAVTVLLNDYLGSITSSFNIASHDHGLWSEENEDAIVIKHNHHQESSTWPQCTQTRMSNIGSCPRCSPSNLNKPNVNRVWWLWNVLYGFNFIHHRRTSSRPMWWRSREALELSQIL